jgi:hypothetical protein
MGWTPTRTSSFSACVHVVSDQQRMVLRDIADAPVVCRIRSHRVKTK